MHRWFRICALAALAAWISPEALAQQDKRLDKLVELLEALTQKVDLQNKQIETLNEDINRLSTALQEHLAAAPAPTPKPVPKPPPAPADGSTHIVQRGENLTSIARLHDTTVDELLKLNKIEDERKLQVGQSLLLPKPAPAPTPAPPHEP